MVVDPKLKGIGKERGLQIWRINVIFILAKFKKNQNFHRNLRWKMCLRSSTETSSSATPISC